MIAFVAGIFIGGGAIGLAALLWFYYAFKDMWG